MKILLIDEDEYSMPQLVDELKEDKHRVEHVKARPQLHALGKWDFDLILLDLMMPDTAGEFGEEGRHGYLTGVLLYETDVAPDHSGIPFCILTAVAPGTTVYTEAQRRLKRYPSYLGLLRKPTSADRIVELYNTSRSVRDDPKRRD